ncbi:TetR/AcrR family transcriptional regulator [Cohnella zeiphila]|uniref:TetR/AcrR family transcriptional regulator n=1 Tax=Cohnella zeiphila TaxID=2761120 RepID=A0A7X0SLI0_9BACL|nr:TetR/AcrR family transcriptional regulator [Cohnella zeiphila]MBB6732086.1 TetR/AcrR family transcriptional regulator [Cohnella zeiphila]
MGEIRNAERTRGTILQAAKEEFFEKGYTGARIESIAKRAGVNKQLIYHYFKGKDELIKETINETIHEFISSLPSGNLALPANPVHIAEFRLKLNLEHLRDFLKFTAWEAVDEVPENVNGEKIRKRILQSYNEDMKSKQEMGLVPEGLDPAFITLMLSSLTNYPLLYGNVTRMITGHTLDEPEFQQQWASFLRTISERIFRIEKTH